METGSEMYCRKNVWVTQHGKNPIFRAFSKKFNQIFSLICIIWFELLSLGHIKYLAGSLVLMVPSIGVTAREEVRIGTMQFCTHRDQ